ADFWYKYVGLEGRIIGMTTYGESAPASALFEAFGFTLENILGTAEELLED
ncbi:transketolase-like TK C-terminal-containing protein, partial [Pseudomonas sp. NPDC089407]